MVVSLFSFFFRGLTHLQRGCGVNDRARECKEHGLQLSASTRVCRETAETHPSVSEVLFMEVSVEMN